MTTILDRYKKSAGTTAASTINLADWNGLCDDVGNTLAALVRKGADFDALASVAIGVLLNRINDVLGPAYDQVTLRGQQIEALYASLTAMGVSANVVQDTVARYMLTDARRASILSDALAAANTADAALLSGLVDSATSDRNTLRKLGLLIDANTASLSTLVGNVPSLDSFRSLAMYVARANGKAIGLINGFADDFTDNSGIDLANSANIFLDIPSGTLNSTAPQAMVAETISSLPKMVSNSKTATGAEGYLVSGDSVYDGTGTYDFWKAMDGSGSTYWNSAATGYPHTYQVKVPTGIKLAAYAVTGYSSDYMSAWLFQGSNTANGTDWVTLDQQTGQNPTNRIVYNIAAASQGTYQYYRIYCTAGVHANQIGLVELELLQSAPMVESDTSLPAMTSATTTATGATGYAVTASSIVGGQPGPAFRAMDGVYSTNNNAVGCWDTDAGVLPHTITLQTPSAIRVGAYFLTNYNDGQNYCYPGTWQLLGSNDGLKWDILDSRVNDAANTGTERRVRTVAPANQGFYKYHRLSVSMVYTSLSATRIILPEWGLLQVITGVEGQTSIPVMTGNSAPAGYAAAASSLYQVGFEAWRAFDGLTSYYDTAWKAQNGSGTGMWHAASSGIGWVSRQFPAGIKAVAYRLASLATYSPTAWKIQGTNAPDDSAWVDLDSRNVPVNFWQSAYGTWNYFTIQSPGTYTRYRIYITAATTDGYPRVSELEFLQATTGNMDLKSIVRKAPAGVPAKATMYAVLKTNAGTLNINTNLVMSISRNGTAGTFKPFVMTAVATVGVMTIYESASLDLSSLPSSDQVVARMQTTDGILNVGVDYWMPLWG